jgi:hypothetical protein
VLRPAARGGSPQPKTAAARLLAVSKAGYVARSFQQSADTRANLVLSLYSNPDAAAYASAKQACLDTVNALRILSGLQALSRSPVLEAFADSGARYDGDHESPHGDFGAQGRPLVADAENELPGWGYDGSLSDIVKDGTKMMWDEGPGGGHYENIKGNHAAMGCGIYVNGSGAVWVVQDFR